jgi:hypothetical protein
MGNHTDSKPLTPVQRSVAKALAAGSTLTAAAEAHQIHRVTLYRWMKTSKPFAAALHRARAEFVLGRRDALYHLSNRAIETLLHILDNPAASPAVLLRTAMFILQRPQLPKTGWSMPEPAPDPDGNKLLDSAIIEQDYNSLPGLCNIERDFETGPEDEAEPATEHESPIESVTSEPSDQPAPPPADAAECNTMQHNFENRDRVAWAPPSRRPAAPPSSPKPAANPVSQPESEEILV